MQLFQEKALLDEYNTKYVLWQDKIKILEENPKRQKDLVQCRRYFEAMFPTIKKKLEQEERFNRWAALLTKRKEIS